MAKGSSTPVTLKTLKPALDAPPASVRESPVPPRSVDPHNFAQAFGGMPPQQSADPIPRSIRIADKITLPVMCVSGILCLLLSIFAYKSRPSPNSQVDNQNAAISARLDGLDNRVKDLEKPKWAVPATNP